MQLASHLLPDIDSLRRRAKALAMLDAIICLEWEFRCFSFNAAWGEGEEMASMRNGVGDEWFLLFCPAGAAIKGFGHETAAAGDSRFAEEIQRLAPSSFGSFLHEPAFSMDQASFCYWRAVDDAAWSRVAHPDPKLASADDGSRELLELLLLPPSGYKKFASDYFELDIPLAAVEQIYAHRPLTTDLLRALNPEVDLAEVEHEAAEIGYCGGL